MKSIWDTRPSKGEYGPFYQTYIDKLRPGNIIDILESQGDEVNRLIMSQDEEQALHRYEEEKWSVKEVFGHMMDTERVFCHRALSISRNDPNDLPGFEQDDYVNAVDFDTRSIESLAREQVALRENTIQLFKGFSKQMLERTGIANNYSLSVRAVPFIIAGHERHHLLLLESRYGLQLP
ncbi:DinB family protein [Aliifodinibius sp. S!AR15-10]|uniref:DinB family protein n=1 Tax=Aliifodinibius sp. S!AR15-10 TaxID=2950437 RepID=UPI0028679E85|nr:DinB family protein [Aliifodinibius sp. S!AR15-10]MDR8391703.1 DinB family protein [Aliifodinibius sp. S!AR15-10]